MDTLSWSKIPNAIKSAAICALAGFFVSCSASSTSSVNGRLTDCSYTDVGALTFGGVAIVGGLVGIVSVARDERDDRAILIAIAAVSIAVGVVHILRGVGTVGGPCN